MSFETLYLAGVLAAFSIFFITVTLVWFINRLPDKAGPKLAQATPARRPEAVEPPTALAA